MASVVVAGAVGASKTTALKALVEEFLPWCIPFESSGRTFPLVDFVRDVGAGAARAAWLEMGAPGQAAPAVAIFGRYEASVKSMACEVRANLAWITHARFCYHRQGTGQRKPSKKYASQKWRLRRLRAARTAGKPTDEE